MEFTVDHERSGGGGYFESGYVGFDGELFDDGTAWACWRFFDFSHFFFFFSR